MHSYYVDNEFIDNQSLKLKRRFNLDVYKNDNKQFYSVWKYINIINRFKLIKK